MQYDLVFEGGGAKGMVFVGACEEFFRRGHTFGRLLGTSAGAITATLLAAGYSPKEMLEALVERENGASVFAGFMGQPPAFSDAEIEASTTLRFLQRVDLKFLWDKWEKKFDLWLARALAGSEQFRNVLALVERGGWFAADRFVAWLCGKLDSGRCPSGPRRYGGLSLLQFFEATGVELSLVASDTADARILVLNYRTAPDCPVVSAVRMSMSIPLVWDEVIWQRPWGDYLGRDVQGHAVVDGGVLSNFPIELFISDRPHVVRLMGQKHDKPVLGMLIDERLTVSHSKGLLVDVDIGPAELKTLQRLRRLVDTATTAHDKMVIDEYSDLVVRLPAVGYGTTEFDMSDERREALVAAGRAAMACYLDAHVGPPVPAERFEKSTAAATSAADRIASSILSAGGHADT